MKILLFQCARRRRRRRADDLWCTERATFCRPSGERRIIRQNHNILNIRYELDRRTAAAYLRRSANQRRVRRPGGCGRIDKEQTRPAVLVVRAKSLLCVR